MNPSRHLLSTAWLLIAAGLALPCATLAQLPEIQYPVTRSVDTVDDYHGSQVPDLYRWLEAIDAADVADWVEAQNSVTLPYLAALPAHGTFKTRITELYNYERSSVPFWEGGRWFYKKNSGLQRQDVWYSRTTLDGPEELVIDPNQLSPDGSVALTNFTPSPDGKHYALGLSEGGSDWRTVHVRDLTTGKSTADTIRWVKFSRVSWTKDGRGFFYSRFPGPPSGKQLKIKLENQTLYYHVLGTLQSADLKIYERPDHPTWFVSGRLNETGQYLFVSTAQGTDKNELYVAELGDPLQPDLRAPVKAIVTGHDANYGPLGVANGQIYLRVDKDAPMRKVVAVPVDAPEPANWKTVIPEGSQPIEKASLVAGKIGIVTLEDVASVIRLYELDGSNPRAIEMPRLGRATEILGRFDRPEVFYSFASPLQPTTSYQYDVTTHASQPFNPPQLTFDPSRLVTERVFYESKDGTRVPMFLTHRKDLVKNGQTPTMLYAYGGFDITISPRFRPAVIAWVEQGGLFAQANLRGGGEYGEEWHHGGMFEKKQNVFDDFIAAAEYLVREQYTAPAHLAINGRSNGGLLVGAVMNQRPDLYAAAVPQVGVMDMLRYHQFTGGAAWATEYGVSNDSTAFRYLYAYSPLHNVKSDECYPATLITTADHDDRVVPSHSFKFAAALQTAQSPVEDCDKPVLIRIEHRGSHGYRPLDRRIAELTDIWAFTAYHTGMAMTSLPAP
jgi:prolyl oligopeptidase